MRCWLIFHRQGGEALALPPRKAVDAPSLEAPKARPGGALGSLSWCLI